MAKAPSRQLDKFIIRLPDGMRDHIKAAASASHRTMNDEVIFRLEASFHDAERSTGMAWVKRAKQDAAAATSELSPNLELRIGNLEKGLAALLGAIAELESRFAQSTDRDPSPE
jgi:hypothetical protein